MMKLEMAAAITRRRGRAKPQITAITESCGWLYDWYLYMRVVSAMVITVDDCMVMMVITIGGGNW